jgi:signal transduction histidine kinase
VLAIFTPAVLSALLVVPLVVHRALRPLRRAGREAEAIGFETLDRRLSLEGLTKEVSPFVAAINALLERLAAGAARQRRFAADAAHELRTPVAILRARLSTLPAFDGKKELERDARRISMLVDQLLSAARLSRADMKPTVPVRLDRIARDVVGNCAPLALNTGRDIAFLGSNKPVQIIGDEEALTSAITNLVDNAIRAEPKGGTVEVATGLGEGGREGWVEVRDHGRGVPEADRDNLFEPFWRNGDTGSGTGLGLAIVREIASAHEGRASMRPGPDWRGAVFRLEFPAC